MNPLTIQRKLSIILSAIFILCNTEYIACRCIDPSEFKEIYQQSDLVALVKVSKYMDYNGLFPESMEAEILYTHIGRSTHKLIKIYGGNGGNCRTTIKRDLFKNKYLIVSLFKMNDGYAFGSCGNYSINVTLWVYSIYLVLGLLLITITWWLKKKYKVV